MEDKKQSSGAGKASRRDFLKKGALATAAMMAGPGLFKTPVYGQKQAPFLGSVLGANDRIVAGFIGVGGQGGYSWSSLADEEVTMLCDVDLARVAECRIRSICSLIDAVFSMYVSVRGTYASGW